MSDILLRSEFDVIENSREKVQIRYNKDARRTGHFQIVVLHKEPNEQKYFETSSGVRIKDWDLQKLIKALTNIGADWARREGRIYERIEAGWRLLSSVEEPREARLQRLSKLLGKIHELKKQHLCLKRKSFKFEFRGFDCAHSKDVPGEDVGIFKGRLIIPRQDYGLFNVGCVGFSPGAGPGVGSPHRNLPLLYDHNPRMLIGAILLGFVFPSVPAGTHCPSAKTELEKRRFFEKWELLVRGVLVFAAEKAKEICIEIEKRGQKAIKELEVGYRIEKPVRGQNLTTFIYEVSIKGVKHLRNLGGGLVPPPKE